jgi:hypothetical protein
MESALHAHHHSLHGWHEQVRVRVRVSVRVRARARARVRVRARVNTSPLAARLA